MIITDEDDQKRFQIPQPKPSTTLFEPVPVVSDVVNAPCSDSDEQKTLDPNFFPEIPSKLDSFPHHLDPNFSNLSNYWMLEIPATSVNIVMPNFCFEKERLAPKCHKCCAGGKIRLPPLTNLPYEFGELYYPDEEDTTHHPNQAKFKVLSKECQVYQSNFCNGFLWLRRNSHSWILPCTLGIQNSRLYLS